MYETVSFGQWLKQKRKSLRLTQEELAERIGCSDIAIRKIEADTRRPSRQVAELIADLFKVPAEEREAFIALARGFDDQSKPPQQSSHHRPLSNLPAQLTNLIGREEITSEIASYLLQDDVRLLTLTGPPGIGKTSLGMHVAAVLTPDFPDGVFFVALAPIVEPAMVAATIAKAFGLTDSGRRPLGDALVNLLRDKKILLLLDNFEQVIEAAPSVVNILERCPQLKIITTSREPLHVRGERLIRVPPLQVPTRVPSTEYRVPGAQLEADQNRSLPATRYSLLGSIPSVALFVERARAVRPDFALAEGNAEAVATICRRLEGLPLAIELVAARIGIVSPQEMEARLRPLDASNQGDEGPDTHFNLLSGGPRDLPPRQRTLRNAIDWSYTLLSDGERTLFSRLGVFMGGFDIPAAEAICNARGDLPFDMLDGVGSLLDKSLLKLEEKPHGVSRYSMLEMIREYALAHLDTNPAVTDHSSLTADRSSHPTSPTSYPSLTTLHLVRLQHAEYFLALAEEAEIQLRGSQQVGWLYRLEEEHDNLRSVLRWTLQQSQAELALRMAGTLWKFWELHGYLSEGRGWLAAALSLPDEGTRTKSKESARARALFAAGRLAERQGDYASSHPLLEESLTMARRLDDKQLIALVLHNLSNLATYRADYSQARTFAQESLAIRTELGDRWGMANTLHNMGFQAEAMGDHTLSRLFYEQSLQLSRELDDKWGVAYSLDGVGLLALEQTDYALANALLRESLMLRRELGDKSGIARSLERLARAAGRQMQPARAARLFGAAEAIREAEDIPIMPVDRSEHEEAVAQAHRQLDEAAWARAWQEGRAMPLQDATTYALELHPGGSPDSG